MKLKLGVVVLIVALLSSFAAAQLDIPDVGPGGCIPVHPTTGAPCPECCPGGGAVQPPPDDVKPIQPQQPQEPEKQDPEQEQIIPVGPDDKQDAVNNNGQSVQGITQENNQCAWACTEWTPSNCQGGLQERDCECNCPVCDGDSTEKKVCPLSTAGYVNIQTGSYWHGEPVQFYLAETDGKLWLISGDGQPIEGIGLHVGEPDATVPINPLLSDITNYRKAPAGKYSAEIRGADFADTTVQETPKGFDLGFKVKPNAKVGKKEMTLDVTRDGTVVASLPLVADIQPALKKEQPPEHPDYSSAILAVVGAGFVVFALLAWLIAAVTKKSKKARGTASLALGVIGVLFFALPFVGLPSSVFALLFSRLQNKRKKTWPATVGFGIGLIGIILNLIILVGLLGQVY